jgi:hypothetical protein
MVPELAEADEHELVKRIQVRDVLLPALFSLSSFSSGNVH